MIQPIASGLIDNDSNDGDSNFLEKHENQMQPYDIDGDDNHSFSYANNGYKEIEGDLNGDGTTCNNYHE
eukprot:7955321-Ditylum_brightwellii.AAC.1